MVRNAAMLLLSPLIKSVPIACRQKNKRDFSEIVVELFHVDGLQTW
jgi:hypothetical protein